MESYEVKGASGNLALSSPATAVTVTERLIRPLNSVGRDYCTRTVGDPNALGPPNVARLVACARASKR